MLHRTPGSKPIRRGTRIRRLTLDFGGKRGASRVGQPVVPPQPALFDLLAIQFGEPITDQPVQHAVQSPDLEVDPPIGELGDRTDDPVTMAGCAYQRSQDKESLFRHRP